MPVESSEKAWVHDRWPVGSRVGCAAYVAVVLTLIVLQRPATATTLPWLLLPYLFVAFRWSRRIDFEARECHTVFGLQPLLHAQTWSLDDLAEVQVERAPVWYWPMEPFVVRLTWRTPGRRPWVVYRTEKRVNALRIGENFERRILAVSPSASAAADGAIQEVLA